MCAWRRTGAVLEHIVAGLPDDASLCSEPYENGPTNGGMDGGLINFVAIE